jgi:hypothetical protein
MTAQMQDESSAQLWEQVRMRTNRADTSHHAVTPVTASGTVIIGAKV